MASEFVEANRAYFDKLATQYEAEDWQQKMIAQTSAEIRKKLDFIGVDWVKSLSDTTRSVRLLDYACGPGTVTRALGPCITESVGIDISSKMVEVFNERVGELPKHVKAHAFEGNLLDNEDQPEGASEASLQNFDIAAVGMGFHHFEHPALAIEKLAKRLKPGGVVLIIDITKEVDWSEAISKTPEAGATIGTHGFTENEMKEVFERAGLVKTGYSVMQEKVEFKPRGKNGTMLSIFLARAEKPNGS